MSTKTFNLKLAVVHGEESEAQFMGGGGQADIETWAIENLPEGIYVMQFTAEIRTKPPPLPDGESK